MGYAAAAKLLQSCPPLCDPIDSSLPDSSVPGILQARILEWVVISFSNACMHAKSLQLCLTLCYPMDSSPPGSSIHRILQARIRDWGVISFSQYAIKQLMNHRRNQEYIKKIPRDKWWKHNNLKTMEYSKSSSKRGVYSNLTLPQGTRKINNLNIHNLKINNLTLHRSN